MIKLFTRIVSTQKHNNSSKYTAFQISKYLSGSIVRKVAYQQLYNIKTERFMHYLYFIYYSDLAFTFQQVYNHFYVKITLKILEDPISIYTNTISSGILLEYKTNLLSNGYFLYTNKKFNHISYQYSCITTLSE